jgi:hypothetical protein
MGRRDQVVSAVSQASSVAAPAAIPPLARRPVISPAMALREEINDSWRLLVGSLGAALVVAGVLYLLAAALG